MNAPRWLRGAVVGGLGGLCALLAATPSVAEPARTVPRASSGGQIVIGAEQEPDCADWIDACAGESWGLWTMQEETMPRVFDVVRRGAQWVYTPSVLMAAPPTLSTVNGAQTVTYRINPDAVWSDGVPITSADFAYTWDQVAHGADIFDRTGYDQIAVGQRHRPPHRGGHLLDTRSRAGGSCSAPTTACSPATSSPATTATMP